MRSYSFIILLFLGTFFIFKFCIQRVVALHIRHYLFEFSECCTLRKFAFFIDECSRALGAAVGATRSRSPGTTTLRAYVRRAGRAPTHPIAFARVRRAPLRARSRVTARAARLSRHPRRPDRRAGSRAPALDLLLLVRLLVRLRLQLDAFPGEARSHPPHIRTRCAYCLRVTGYAILYIVRYHIRYSNVRH